MASFRWILCLSCFYLNVIETQSWTIKVPSVVKGLPGSCVVIPCSYDFPTPKKPPTKYTGMWKDARDQFIYHPDQSKVKPAMRGRTRLTGSLIQKDCSLEINPLKLDDRGFFHFRISLTGYNSYSYVKNTVTISKIDDLDPMSLSVDSDLTDEHTIALSCSVIHSCPTHPPVFTWNHPGQEVIENTPMDDGQLRTTSLLSFPRVNEDHNKIIECSATYKDGKHQQDSLLLKVISAPAIRNTSYCTFSAKLIKCVCIVDSSPSSMLQFEFSNKILDSTVLTTDGTVTTGILQVEEKPEKFIHCLATNSQGTANLTLAVIFIPSSRTNLYIIIAVGGGVILLTLGILAKVIQKWRWTVTGTGPPPAAQLQMEKEVALPQRMRKDESICGNKGGQTTGYEKNLYQNIQLYMHDPTYASLTD